MNSFPYLIGKSSIHGQCSFMFDAKLPEGTHQYLELGVFVRSGSIWVPEGGCLAAFEKSRDAHRSSFLGWFKGRELPDETMFSHHAGFLQKYRTTPRYNTSHPIKMLYMGVSIGVPLNHPFSWIFPYKRSIFGHPHSRKPPHT